MSEFFVVVDKLKDWAPYYPSQDVITIDQYIKGAYKTVSGRVRVINLSRHYKYLSTGYYCSLLAEARGHHVLPSVQTLSDLGKKSLTTLRLIGIDKILSRLPEGKEKEIITVRCWFGETARSDFSILASRVFEYFPFPLLDITIEYKDRWDIKNVRPIALTDLTENEEQEAFAQAFERFSLRLWRKPRSRKSFRYDLAILVNPDEALPPSDQKAIKKFIKAANHLDISAELVTKEDYVRLPEYDGLFIRETTSVNHHTYRFAKKAESEGMVVIDDPTSILRCTNKIYLAELLQTNNISTPKTEIFSNTHSNTLQHLVDAIGFPMVIKIPDGSFSRGIVKVGSFSELKKVSAELFRQSALLIAQAFTYTKYDWRIGILNNKPLYACRYYMVNDHWQIYQHEGDDIKDGDFDTMPTFEVPKQVLNIATKATRLIGDGFYGVDIKQSDEQVYIIEVNDNPSIDAGVEDKYLGDQLYMEFMEEFLRRMTVKKQ